MIRQQLSQKLLQKLSPQQIQLMKLLQIPTVSLEQRIKEELEANPALEEPDDYSESNAESTQDEKESESDKDDNDDYDIERFSYIIAIADGGSYLALDAVSRHCSSVLFADGDADSRFVSDVLSVVDDVVLAFKIRSGLDDLVEFLML